MFETRPCGHSKNSDTAFEIFDVQFENSVKSIAKFISVIEKSFKFIEKFVKFVIKSNISFVEKIVVMIEIYDAIEKKKTNRDELFEKTKIRNEKCEYSEI